MLILHNIKTVICFQLPIVQYLKKSILLLLHSSHQCQNQMCLAVQIKFFGLYDEETIQNQSILSTITRDFMSIHVTQIISQK